MSPVSRNTVLAIITLAGMALSPLAISHFNDKEIAQSYRQSWFAILATNFGPIAAMVKGDMPWDEKQMAGYSEQMAALMNVDVMRGFAAGSEKGTTKAKPEIWKNTADFQKNMDDLKTAVTALQVATAQGSDRKAITAQVAATGKACKACHDEYTAEEYLY